MPARDLFSLSRHPPVLDLDGERIFDSRESWRRSAVHPEPPSSGAADERRRALGSRSSSTSRPVTSCAAGLAFELRRRSRLRERLLTHRSRGAAMRRIYRALLGPPGPKKMVYAPSLATSFTGGRRDARVSSSPRRSTGSRRLQAGRLSGRHRPHHRRPHGCVAPVPASRGLPSCKYDYPTARLAFSCCPFAASRA